MNKTAIGWTDWTWNPFSGCHQITAACDFCYAKTVAEQKQGKAFPHGFGLTIRRPEKWTEPERVKTPSLIFVNSMSDVGLADGELTSDETERLHEAGLANMDALRDKLLDAIEAAPWHRHQLLTKRPKIVLEYLRRRGRKLPASVWMGVTIEDNSQASRVRFAELPRFRDFGAVVLFVSAEPLLEDLTELVFASHDPVPLRHVDWIVVGGESGLHVADAAQADRFLVRRSTPLERRVRKVGAWVPREDRIPWILRLRAEAAYAGAAFFFKQWGGPLPTSAGRELDGRTYDGMPVHVPGAMPDRSVKQPRRLTLITEGVPGTADRIALDPRADGAIVGHLPLMQTRISPILGLKPRMDAADSPLLRPEPLFPNDAKGG